MSVVGFCFLDDSFGSQARPLRCKHPTDKRYMCRHQENSLFSSVLLWLYMYSYMYIHALTFEKTAAVCN